MSKSNQRTVDMVLEALNNGFRFTFHVVKEFLHLLGIVFIDKMMRAIVSWYDKVHQSTTNAGRRSVMKDSVKINALQSQVDELKRIINEDKIQIDSFVSELECVKNEARNLSIEKHELEEIVQSMNDQIKRDKLQIDDLIAENSELMKHSISPDFVPATIVYAEGDASSTNLRKPNVRRQSTTLYEIHTEPGNYSEGIYYALTPNNVSLIIENRSVALRACRIDYVESNANAIVTIAPGRVRKNGKEWELLEPAVIKLVKQ